MSVIMAREGVSFVLTGLVENICSGSLNPRKGSYGWWEGDGLGKHGPCCTEQEEWGKKWKITSSHNNTPPETNK